MFPARYFPTRFFNARFWVKTGEVADTVAPSYACARLEAVRGLAGLESVTATARIEANRGSKP